MKQATFHRGFLWAALAAALGAGFPIGAHLTFVVGFGFPISAGYASFVQAHGHVQLMGWVGLFIMGISLHFLPRLAGVPIARPHWLPALVWLMGLGLVLRSLGHSILPYLHTFSVSMLVVAWVTVLSGLLEWGAVLGYVALLVTVFRGVGNAAQRPALLSVRPYLGMMVCGWSLYASLNLLLLGQMAVTQAVILHATWNFWAIQSFLGLVLLPVAFAFSLRMFPLYLRLPPVDGSASIVAVLYFIATATSLCASLPVFLTTAAPFPVAVLHCSTVFKVAVILWFVWKLDVLTRRRQPWTVQRQLHPGPERRPTRPGLPDYGEFGRFEWLIYAAYTWLILAALTEAASAFSSLAGRAPLVSSTAILHMYLMGFISLLIFGMAVRMLPGFMHKRRVASAALVEATFWLGNLAALFRVALFVLPAGLLQRFPGLHTAGRIAFALSGLLALAAVWALAVNLWRTSRLP